MDHMKSIRLRTLTVGGLLASVGGAQNRSILRGRAGVGLAIARERPDEGCIAAERATQGCGAVDDEVKAPAVVGRDAWCCGVDEPLLGHHVSLRPHGFTGNLAPGPLHKFGPPCREASSRARKCMVSKSISTAAAPRFRSAPAATRCERELEPEPATQRDLHCLGGERGVGVAWDGLEPCSGMRTGLGAQERTVGWRQGRQQHVVAEENVPCARRTVLPPMPPFTGLGDPLRSVRRAGSLHQELPGRRVGPAFSHKQPAGFRGCP